MGTGCRDWHTGIACSRDRSVSAGGSVCGRGRLADGSLCASGSGYHRRQSFGRLATRPIGLPVLIVLATCNKSRCDDDMARPNIRGRWGGPGRLEARSGHTSRSMPLNSVDRAEMRARITSRASLGVGGIAEWRQGHSLYESAQVESGRVANCSGATVVVSEAESRASATPTSCCSYRHLLAIVSLSHVPRL